MYNYNKALVARAREMRSGATKQERRLWYDFLSGYPVRCHRQKIIGSYIADFFCPQAKLVIELDGAHHVWNLVALEDYHFHFDISMLHELGPTLTLFVPDDVMMFQNGYSWDTTLYDRADSSLRYEDF